MGRYFPYRMHPLTVGELLTPAGDDRLTRPATAIGDDDAAALWDHGGFPEPFVKRNAAFSRRWRAQRLHLLVREDVRALSPIHDLTRLETLVILLAERSGSPLVYSNLAKDLQVSVDTVRRWVDVRSDTSSNRPEPRTRFTSCGRCRSSMPTPSPVTTRASSPLARSCRN